MPGKHRKEDESKQENSSTQREKEQQQIETLRKTSKKIKQFFNANTERARVKGKPVKSNITDNETAKLKISYDVLQEYNGVAAEDNQNQIISAAEQFDQGPENILLEPLVEQAKINLGTKYTNQARLTIDSGFRSRNNLKYCEEENIDAYVTDGKVRKRDPRIKEYERFKPEEKLKKHFSPSAKISDGI